MPTGEFPKTDFDKRTIELSEIMSGGPPRDGIPAVDVPRYTTTEEAGGWLDPDEPVIAVEIGGEAPRPIRSRSSSGTRSRTTSSAAPRSR